VEDAAFHAAGDRYDLAGDMSREPLGGEHDDVCRHVDVGPGATALIRTLGPSRAASFFSESGSPLWIADFAAAACRGPPIRATREAAV
jgi:hypothetical protein